MYSAYEIWGKQDIPYLKKVELPRELKSVRADSAVRYRKAVKNGQLGVYGNDRWLGIDGFRLKINRVLGWNRLKSNDFSIRVTEDKIVFQGKGFGHLVGLGQRDAVYLAREGYDYIRILELFYPGCKSSRVDEEM